MLCREVKMSISPYLDGRLDDGQARQLENHVAACEDCRQKLEVLREIPVALKTDRMLAPQTDFTKLVMQRIIVREQVTAQLVRHEVESIEVVVSRPKTANAQKPVSPKVVSLNDYKARRTKRPYEYILQFSAVAAVLVVMVTVGIVISGDSSNNATAAVYTAVTNLGDSLRDALSSPTDFALGFGVTAIVLIGLWYIFRLLRLNSSSNISDNNDAPDYRRRA